MRACGVAGRRKQAEAARGAKGAVAARAAGRQQAQAVRGAAVRMCVAWCAQQRRRAQCAVWQCVCSSVCAGCIGRKAAGGVQGEVRWHACERAAGGGRAKRRDGE